MASDDRPGVEEDGPRRDGIGAVVDGLIKIRERPVGDGVVEPIRQGVDEHSPGWRTTRRRRPHLPVGFRIRVSRVKRDAEDLRDGRVPGRLHVVDALWDDVEG